MKITELEQCLAILIHLARDRGVEDLAPPERDAYWTVTSPEWRQSYADPTPAVGSFSDDEDLLKKMLADPGRASSVDLERVAHLLRLLSDQLAY